MSEMKIEDIKYKPAPGTKKRDVVIGNVHHFRKRNYRKNYGTDAELRKTREALARYGGWDYQQTMVCEVATEEEIAEAIVERTAFHTQLTAWAAVPGQQQDLYKAQLRIYEHPDAGFMDADGNILGPTCIGVTANRRASQYLPAMGQCLLDVERFQGKIENLHFGVNALVPKTEGGRFPTEKLRTEAQIRENSSKTEGFLEPNDAEKLASARRLVEQLGVQSDVRKHYGATPGLRLYFAVVIAMYEEANKMGLRFYDRLTTAPWIDGDPASENPKAPTYEKSYKVGQGAEAKTVDNLPNPDWLDYSMFTQAAFQGLAGDTVPEHLKKYPMGRMCDGDESVAKVNKDRAAKDLPPIEAPSKDMLEDWIEFCCTGKTGQAAAKMMKPERVEQMYGARIKSSIVRSVARAIRRDDIALYEEVEKRADGTNALMEVEAETYSAMAKGLSILVTLPPAQQIAIAKQFAEAMSGVEPAVVETESAAKALEHAK